MTNEQMEKVFERALADDAYLTKLLSSPKDAVAELGGAISDDEEAAIKAMSAAEFKSFVAEYRSAADPNKRRAAC